MCKVVRRATIATVANPRPPDRPRRRRSCTSRTTRRAHARRVGAASSRARAPAYDELVEHDRGAGCTSSRATASGSRSCRSARAGRVWVDDPHFNAALPHPPHRAARARRRRASSSSLAGRLFSQRAGPRQAAVGDLARRGPRRRPLRADRQDPPRARRRRLRRRHHDRSCSTPRPTRRRPRRRPRAVGRRARRPAAPSCSAEALLERATVPGRDRPRRCARCCARRARSLGQAARAAWSGVGAMALGRAAARRRRRRSTSPIGPHRRYTWVDADLARFKAIKNALGGTVNDVVLTAVALALGRYLRAPRRATPTASCCKAMVPVSVRADAERGALGNRVAAMWAPLPVGVERPGRRASREVARGDGRTSRSPARPSAPRC